MKSFSNLRFTISEKTLTPAEMKKREEIAKAIERDDPSMPMAKKMAIATDTAKKVAEELDEAADMANLRKQLDKHTELAIQANRDGDDVTTKKHQQHIGKIKDQMARLVRSGSEELDEALTTLQPGTYGGMNVVHTATGKRIGGVVGPKGPNDIYVGVHGSGQAPDQQKEFKSQSAAHEWVRARQANLVKGTKALIRATSPKAPDGTPRLPPSARRRTKVAEAIITQPPKKVDIPAAIRKAQGGNWKTTTQDIEADNLRNQSSSQSLAAGRKKEGMAEANNNQPASGRRRDVERGRGMETHPGTPPLVRGPHSVVFGDKVVHKGLSYEAAWAKAISLNNRLNHDTATTFHDVVKEPHSMEEGFVVRNKGKVVATHSSESGATRIANRLSKNGTKHTVSYKRSEVMPASDTPPDRPTAKDPITGRRHPDYGNSAMMQRFKRFDPKPPDAPVGNSNDLSKHNSMPGKNGHPWAPTIMNADGKRMDLGPGPFQRPSRGVIKRSLEIWARRNGIHHDIKVTQHPTNKTWKVTGKAGNSDTVHTHHFTHRNDRNDFYPVDNPPVTKVSEGFVVRDPTGKVVLVAAAESAARQQAAALTTSTGVNHTVSYKRSEVMPEEAVEEGKKQMKGEDPCWDDYKMVGTKKKNGKEVPNCVPEEVDLQEMWRTERSAATGRHYVVTGYNDKRKIWKDEKYGAGDFTSESDARQKAEELNSVNSVKEEVDLSEVNDYFKRRAKEERKISGAIQPKKKSKEPVEPVNDYFKRRAKENI